MLILVANILVIMGGGMLIRVLFLTQHLFNSLPSRELQARKYFLMVPVLLFILGYLGYLITYWNAQKNWPDLLVPVLIFSSASALWVIYKLSLQPVIRFALEQGNITDTLTGVYNRRYLERRLTDEIARAQRYSLPLSVFLLDIDQFNRVNAAYGRLTGDQILVHLARLILEYVRESDEVSRYGEDAMLIMAPNTSIHDAHLLAERIRQHIEIQPLLHVGAGETERVAIQISIGVATLQGGFDSLDKLLQRTELALQQAQQKGGNCVVASESGGIGNHPA